MLRNLCIGLLLIVGPLAWGQAGVTFHQSGVYSSVGINAEFKQRVLAEARILTDRFLADTHAELVVSYQFLNKEDVEAYAGVGFITSGNLEVPVGLIAWPFQEKKFGFHVELAPIFEEGEPILRSSWGIRYRFIKN